MQQFRFHLLYNSVFLGQNGGLLDISQYMGRDCFSKIGSENSSGFESVGVPGTPSQDLSGIVPSSFPMPTVEDLSCIGQSAAHSLVRAQVAAREFSIPKKRPNYLELPGAGFSGLSSSFATVICGLFCYF